MNVKNFTELGIEKIQEIFDQGWNPMLLTQPIPAIWSDCDVLSIASTDARPPP